MNVEKKIEEIFRRVCKLEASTSIYDSMNSKDQDGWDSITNIQLVSELESVFNIEFQFQELLELSNVGDYKKIVKKKLNMK